MATIQDLTKRFAELLNPIKNSLNDDKGWVRQGKFAPIQQIKSVQAEQKVSPIRTVGPLILPNWQNQQGQDVYKSFGKGFVDMSTFGLIQPKYEPRTQYGKYAQNIGKLAGFVNPLGPGNLATRGVENLGTKAIIKYAPKLTKSIGGKIVGGLGKELAQTLAYTGGQIASGKLGLAPSVPVTPGGFAQNLVLGSVFRGALSPQGTNAISRGVKNVFGGEPFVNDFKYVNEALQKIKTTSVKQGVDLVEREELFKRALDFNEGLKIMPAKEFTKLKLKEQYEKIYEVLADRVKNGDTPVMGIVGKSQPVKTSAIDLSVPITPKATLKTKGIALPEQLQNKKSQPVSQLGVDNGEIPVSPTKSLPTRIKLKSQDSLPQRGFAQTVMGDPNVPKDVKDFVKTITYEPLANKDVLKTVSKIVKRGDSQAISFAKTDETVNGNATAMIMVRKLLEKNRWDEANDLIDAVSPRFTKQGQQIQILSQFSRLEPEGAVRYAKHIIDTANKANPKLKLKLTPENTAEITRLANAIKPLAEGSREKVVAVAQLIQKITDQVPSSVGRKIAGIQTMAQLLNLKTMTRNILGNIIFSGAENVSDTVGAGIDRVVSLITGKRTKVLPSLSAQGKGLVTGLREGAQDVRLGIDTSGGVSSQFDLNTKTFTDPILGTLEKALNYSLRVPDRAAYKATFEGSLNNQMRAAGIKAPTPEMVELAHADGLYRTFQDNSTLANFFSGIKKTLNKIGTPDGKFGLGDLVLKYPKTPANILSRGLDYSPVGFVKGIYQVVRPLIKGQPFNQKQFVENLSRGMVGTGLISAGYVLAQNGIITGKSEKDYDISSVQRTTGQGPFKINVDAIKRFFASGGQKQDVQNGDTLVSYDWAQPMSLSLAMGANMAKGGDLTTSAESLQAGVDTVTGQPMIKNLMDTATDIKNKGIIAAGRNVALNSLSGFNPSIIRQTSNVFDTTQRETYNPSPLGESFNKIKAGIPGARNLLQPKIDVFGKEMPNYQGGGVQRLFDIFINPAFVTKVQENPAAKEVLDIYQRSGETQQAPRVAPETVKINGQSIKVTPEQYNTYQKYIGTQTDTMFNQLVNDPLFQQSSDEDKSKFLANILSDINSAAKIEIFGNTPKSVPDTVKRIINPTNTGYVGLTKDGNLKLTGGTIEKPTLTGNTAVDKKLISGYNSDINSQQSDLMNLYKSGNLSQEKLITGINELELLKVKAPKKPKKIKLPKIKVIKMPKLKKPKKIKIKKPKKVKTPKLSKVKKIAYNG